MSQITRSIPLRGMGRQTSGWAAICLLVGFGIAVVLTIALAMGTFTGSAARIIDTPVREVDSRLDDYGLRHPNPFGAGAASESRLDDYGLRHPNPFGAVDD